MIANSGVVLRTPLIVAGLAASQARFEQIAEQRQELLKQCGPEVRRQPGYIPNSQCEQKLQAQEREIQEVQKKIDQMRDEPFRTFNGAPETPKPVETLKPVEIPKPVETPKPIETVEPQPTSTMLPRPDILGGGWSSGILIFISVLLVGAITAAFKAFGEAIGKDMYEKWKGRNRK
jgi:hypothetical protein